MRRWRTAAKIARSTGNSKARSASSPSTTALTPVSSQSRPNSRGGPMRRQVSPAVSPFSTADSTSARSAKRATEAASRSSSPLASTASLRPRFLMLRCFVRAPSRTLSTR
jgi:hypothetical protein